MGLSHLCGNYEPTGNIHHPLVQFKIGSQYFSESFPSNAVIASRSLPIDS